MYVLLLWKQDRVLQQQGERRPYLLGIHVFQCIHKLERSCCFLGDLIIVNLSETQSGSTAAATVQQRANLVSMWSGALCLWILVFASSDVSLGYLALLPEHGPTGVLFGPIDAGVISCVQGATKHRNDFSTRCK